MCMGAVNCWPCIACFYLRTDHDCRHTVSLLLLYNYICFIRPEAWSHEAFIEPCHWRPSFSNCHCRWIRHTIWTWHTSLLIPLAQGLEFSVALILIPRYTSVDKGNARVNIIPMCVGVFAMQKPDKERLRSLSSFQKRILKHALSFPSVKKVVYSTCSVHCEVSYGL